MPGIFDDLDLSPPAAPAPPAETGPVTFSDLDLSPPRDPLAEQAARQVRAAATDIDRTALQRGEPILSTRPDFAPHLARPGSRNYLSDWSKGLLDLPDTAMSPSQEDKAMTEEWLALKASRPNLARLAAERPDLQAPTLEHLRSLVRLKKTPASPKEILDAGDAAAQDWLKAGASGKLFIDGEPYQPPEIPAPAIRDLWSKIHALPLSDVEDSLSKEDRAVYDALGGAQWFQFAKTRKQFYVGLARKEKLLGQPLRDPAQVPEIRASIFGGEGVPSESPVSFDDFERVSTFAQDLFGRAQDLGVAQAQALSDRRTSLSRGIVGSVLGPSLAQSALDLTGEGALTEEARAQEGFVSKLGRVSLSRPFHALTNTFGLSVQAANEIGAPVLNVLTLGGLNGTLEGIDHLKEGVSGLYTGAQTLTENALQGKYDAALDGDFLDRKVKQGVFFLGRQLALGTKDLQDDFRKAATELEFIEQSFPDLPPDALRELRQSYFGGSQFITGAMRRAAEGNLGGPLQAFSKVFRADSPYMQSVAGENLGPLFESPEGIGFALLGAGQLYNAIARRALRFKDYFDPKRREAVTHLDRHLAETGQFSQAPAAVRAQVLDEINTRISAIPDAAAAGEFVSRVHRAFKDHGAPITPGLKAKIDTAADLFQGKVEDLQGRTLTDLDKNALLDLAEPVAELPGIDAEFVLTGQDRFVSTKGSAEKVSRMKKWYETQVKSIEELDLPRQVDRSMEKMRDVQAGLIEHATREKEFGARQARLIDVTNTLVADLAHKAQELHKSTYATGALHKASIDHFNTYVRESARKNTAIEETGGSVSRANPRIHEPVFERLVTAVQDGGPKLEGLLTDRDLATPERAALLERFKAEEGRVPANAVPPAADQPGPRAVDWTKDPFSQLAAGHPANGAPGVSIVSKPGVTDVIQRDSAGNVAGVLRITHDGKVIEGLGVAVRPDARRAGIASSLYAAAEQAGFQVEKASGAGGLTIEGHRFRQGRRETAIREWARNEIRDRSAPTLTEFKATEKTAAIAESIAAAVDEAAAKGESVVLTQAQKNWLDRHSEARGEKPFKARKAAAEEALRRDLEDAHRRTDETLALAQEIRKLQFQAKHATVDSPKLKLPKKLRKQITEALEEFDIAVEKRYVPLAADASKLEISALEAFKESVDDLSAEHHRLLNETDKISSIELAALGKSAPHVSMFEMEWADRDSKGNLHFENYLAKKFDRLLGKQKDLSRSERRRLRREIYDDWRTGKPRTEAGAKLMQDQRLRLLSEALKTGLVTPERYAEMLGRNYVHGVFDRETQAELAKTGIAHGPDPLMHKIPENGNEYVSWRDDKGQLHSKDGFDTREEALAWANSNIPAGREIAFAKTWPHIEKALSGLVEDAGVSHLSMVEGLTMAIHRHRISSTLAKTPFVLRGTDVADLAARKKGHLNDAGTVFTNEKGVVFTKNTDTHNPALEGRFVSSAANRWLYEHQSGYGLYKGLLEGAQDAHPVKGEGALMETRWHVLNGLTKLGAGALSTGGRIFSTKNIAFSVPTIIKNIISNFVINARLAGVNYLNPIEFAYGIKDAIDGYSARLKPELDEFWQDLARRDIVRFGDESEYHRAGPGAAHSRAVLASLNKNWRTLEGLLDRKRVLEERLDRGEFSGDAVEKARTELLNLENQVQKASTLASRSGFGSIIRHGTDLAGTLYEAIAKGKGRAHNTLWNTFYAEVTGDRIVKYMTYKALLRKGLSKEAALHRVADFHQQLQRVPETVRRTSQKIGASMYMSFPYDQSRIIGNALREDPTGPLRLSLLLSGWNAAAIASSGNSPEDYLEHWALQHGVERDGISDAQALMGGVVLPGGLGASAQPGGVYRISLGPGLWELGTPQSRTGRGAAALMKGDSRSSFWNLLSDATAGAISKAAGGDYYTMHATALSERVDERGDPMKNMGDVMDWLARTHLYPRGAPGSREFDVISRALAGNEVNLQTGRRTSLAQAVGDLFLKTRNEADTPTRFRTALMSQIQAHAGGLTAFRRAQREDEQIDTLIARGALNADGSIDVDRAREVVRQYTLENPTHYLRTDGIKVVESFDEEDIARDVDEFGKPGTLRTFRRQPLPLQISTYAQWLAVDSLAPKRDPEWYEKVRTLLIEKVTGKRNFPADTVQDVNLRIQEALDSGRLLPDAMEDLRMFQELLSRKVARPR